MNPDKINAIATMDHHARLAGLPTWSELNAQVQKSTGEVVAWLVLSRNPDGALSLEYAAPWEEAAHEHINDAINEHDFEAAAEWFVRPACIATCKTEQCAQCQRPYRHGANKTGCPKCAPGVQVLEAEFQKPLPTTPKPEY